MGILFLRLMESNLHDTSSFPLGAPPQGDFFCRGSLEMMHVQKIVIPVKTGIQRNTVENPGCRLEFIPQRRDRHDIRSALPGFLFFQLFRL